LLLTAVDDVRVRRRRRNRLQHPGCDPPARGTGAIRILLRGGRAGPAGLVADDRIGGPDPGGHLRLTDADLPGLAETARVRRLDWHPSQRPGDGCDPGPERGPAARPPLLVAGVALLGH